MKKYLLAVALLVSGMALADPPPVKTNPGVEKIVAEKMVKYNNLCARTTGPADLYLCHSKRWDDLAEQVQGYAFQVERSRDQVNRAWYAEFNDRYMQPSSPYKNCKIRFGAYNPMKAPEITECYIREYFYLESMVDQHNKGTWKPSAPVKPVQAASPGKFTREEQLRYMRSIKETNSNDYEGD